MFSRELILEINKLLSNEREMLDNEGIYSVQLIPSESALSYLIELTEDSIDDHLEKIKQGFQEDYGIELRPYLSKIQNEMDLSEIIDSLDLNQQIMDSLKSFPCKLGHDTKKAFEDKLVEWFKSDKNIFSNINRDQLTGVTYWDFENCEEFVDYIHYMNKSDVDYLIYSNDSSLIDFEIIESTEYPVLRKWLEYAQTEVDYKNLFKTHNIERSLPEDDEEFKALVKRLAKDSEAVKLFIKYVRSTYGVNLLFNLYEGEVFNYSNLYHFVNNAKILFRK